MKTATAKKKKPSKGSIFDHFPNGFSPRPLQRTMLEKIKAALDDENIRFLVVEAPPGVGKSHAAMTILSYMERGYICTATKLLQDQYTSLFNKHDLVEFKGRASFHCERAHNTCAIGGMYYTGKDACQPFDCPYKIAKTKALAANYTVANYSSLLYNADEAGVRDVVVFDEGHEIGKVLMDYVGLEIKNDDLPTPSTKSLPDGNAVPLFAGPYFEWLANYSLDLNRAIPGLGAEKKLEAQQLLEKVTFALEHKDAEEWIVDAFKGKAAGFALKPLTVRSFGDMLFDFGKKIVVLSATILDFSTYCKDIGIDPAQAVFIQEACPFPVKNRPIYVGNLPMTFKHRDESWPIAVKIIENILNHHANVKGLILTPSNEMLHYLVKHLPRRIADRLILAFGEDRKAKLERHLAEKRPTVLAASGFWEGLDLMGDASRFQILPALPRPHWSGQVAARGKIDPQWYRLQTMTKLVQGVGRSIRSETDYAETHVLDRDLRIEANKPRTILPPWFLEALQVAGD